MIETVKNFYTDEPPWNEAEFFQGCLELTKNLVAIPSVSSTEGKRAAAANLPQYKQTDPVPLDAIRDLSIPAADFGCWGKDLHLMTERLDADYSFKILPKWIRLVILSLIGRHRGD